MMLHTGPCGSQEFRCDSGQCIKQNHHCDGDYECADKSDESGCGIYITSIIIINLFYVCIVFPCFSGHSGDSDHHSWCHIPSVMCQSSNVHNIHFLKM